MTGVQTCALPIYGDAVTSTIVIKVVGVPAIVGLDDGAIAGTDGSVLESDLAAGTNAVGVGETLTGTFILAAPGSVGTPGGVKSLTIGATTLTAAQLNLAGTFPITITTANGTLTITGYTKSTGNAPPASGAIDDGTVAYTYLLTSPATSGSTVSDDFAVSLVDGQNVNTSVAGKFLRVAIINEIGRASCRERVYSSV